MGAVPYPNRTFVDHPYQRRPRTGRKREYLGYWPHPIRVHLEVDATGRLRRFMSCAICGGWWERPVGGGYGCSADCSRVARRILRKVARLGR